MKDLALAEATSASEELALDFLPGLACAAAYACETPGSTGRGKGQEKQQQQQKDKDNNKGAAGRRAGHVSVNVKLAPVPSPELLSALAELTKHLKRFHVSQVM